jgi:nucleoside 2-deoxyribosyltransferase
MRNFSCFIACAFDKEDVDEIYDKVIKSVVIELGMDVYRVDRIEHNDDVDDKIIALIHSCDICIADLTYARPSVYFEAGYFKGLNKPVIFTVRKDHFKPKENDIHGNERVHFDLQMKNIIGWSSIEHVKTFSTRLKNRLRLVISPIIKNKQEKEENNKAAKIFNAMPQQKRLDSIRTAIIKKLKSNNWKSITYENRLLYIFYKMIVCQKNSKIIAVFITHSATKKYLKMISTTGILSSTPKSLNRAIQQYHILIVSLRSIPKSRIEDRYPKIELLDEIINMYHTTTKGSEFYFYFMSNIKSLNNFEYLLDNTMDKISKL